MQPAPAAWGSCPAAGCGLAQGWGQGSCGSLPRRHLCWSLEAPSPRTPVPGPSRAPPAACSPPVSHPRQRAGRPPTSAQGPGGPSPLTPSHVCCPSYWPELEAFGVRRTRLLGHDLSLLPWAPQEVQGDEGARGAAALGQGLGEGAAGSPRGSRPVSHSAHSPQAARTHTASAFSFCFRTFSLWSLEGPVFRSSHSSALGPSVLGFREEYVAQAPFPGPREHAEGLPRAPCPSLCPWAPWLRGSVAWGRPSASHSSCPETCGARFVPTEDSGPTREDPSLITV